MSNIAKFFIFLFLAFVAHFLFVVDFPHVNHFNYFSYLANM